MTAADLIWSLALTIVAFLVWLVAGDLYTRHTNRTEGDS